MTEVRRTPADSSGIAKNDIVMVSATKIMDVDPVRRKLRQRWELASVLNFLDVFEPVIESDLKISAEDIETALIEQNSTLAQLHIALLKGIIPANQTLESSDAWIVALSQTLSMWWPWVAKGDFPLTGAKGEEISFYKELEPTARLVVLKALCEVRADQYDAVAYINENIKDGIEVSYFRKDKLASDGNKVTFWYDGNGTVGHRLYKEVQLFETQRRKHKGTVPEINCQWETLATNLEEFRKIVGEFSSSEVTWEVTLSKSVESDVIPVLEKELTRKQRAQKRKEREQMRLNGFRSSVRNRSCRNKKPVNYSYDDYDRTIKEAIKYSNKRNRDSTERDTGGSSHQENNGFDSFCDEENDEEQKDDAKKDRDGNQGNVHSHGQNKPFGNRSIGSRFSKRLAGVPGHTIPESMNLGAKNRSRQRPSMNTAVESIVVPDSEDERSLVEDSEN